MAVQAAVGFLILPLLVSRLGNDGYGLWILIGSLSGSFQFLDFGFRGSVGRFVAYHSALDDKEALSKVLSTAAAILSALGVIAFAAIVLLTYFLPKLIEIPIGQLESARLALLLVGAHLGLWLVTNMFDGALWGLQRFDFLNLIDGTLAIARLSLVYFLVTDVNGLVMLGWITLAMTVTTGVLKAAMSARLMPGIKIRGYFVSRSTVRELTGYGIWNFVASLSNMTVKSLFPVVIGAVLGLAFVAPFAIAKRLIEMVSQFLVAAAGVLIPHTTALSAHNEHEQQRSLFMEASKYCATISLLAVVGLTLLSESFLSLWVGVEYSNLHQLVGILAVGCFVPMLGLLANSLLLGMAHHRCLAVFGILNALCSFVLGAILGSQFGLSGVCLSLAVSGTIFTGICPIVAVFRVLNLSTLEFTKNSVLPAFSVIIFPALALATAVSFKQPSTWLMFASYGSVFSITVLGLAFYLLREKTERSDEVAVMAPPSTVGELNPLPAKELTNVS